MSDDARAAHYIHGTHPEEQGRLSVLNDLLNAASLRELALAGGERVLDLGSGLGQFTRALARAAGPRGRVVGVEGSPQQLAGALRLAREEGEADLADLRQGDARVPPLRDDEWGRFDLAHTRFLLEHLPDPLEVVRTMVRAVRPGGRVVLADDDHDLLRLSPEPPGLAPVWRAYIRTCDRLGNDPYTGRRLVSLLYAAGAVPRRNTLVFFGGCSGQATFPVVVANLIGILRGARGAMETHGLIDPQTFDAAVAALEAWGRRPDAAFWYAMNWAEGVRPAAEG
jgi:SAM-dependent methyltransferase